MAKKSFFLPLASAMFFLCSLVQLADGQTLSGRVYEGTTGTEPPTATAISGVTVKLYGTNNANENPTATGTLITSTTTDEQGWYGLQVSGAFDYYNIFEENPSGYNSDGATSVGGVVKSADWIQYGFVDLSGTTTGNKFWDTQLPPPNNPPIANADGPYTGTVNQPVTFDGSGSYDPDTGDTITLYEWDMDDDGQFDDATGIYPTWTWSSQIVTEVALRVTDNHGAMSGKDSTTVTINPEYQPCDASFSANPTSGCAPLTVYFTDTSSDAQSWWWTFPGGNPGTSTLQNPSITYQNAGSFGAKLKIRCESGQVDSVYVADYIVVNDCGPGCQAAFDADPQVGCAPLTVNFTDKSSNAQSWLWNFPGGNPGTSTLQNPSVTYQQAGSYLVKLKIRCSSGQVDSVYVSDYIVVNDCGYGIDFGDAPDPTYPTLLAGNGARHTIDPDVFLGSSIDAESDGQASAQADGDDVLDGSDDEDGVVFKNAFVRGSYAQFDITASRDGQVGIWVDFNQDGDWADPGESAFNSDTTVFAGKNLWGILVPSNAVLGTTFARFRYTTQPPALDYAGSWPDGEVEDYEVEIVDEGQTGNIKIIKAANPPTGNPQFDFTGDLGTFTLTNGASKSFNNFPPGSYTIIESLPPGWNQGFFQSSGDLDGGTTQNQQAKSLTIDLDAGEDIVIVLYNYKPDASGALVGDRVWNDLNRNGLQEASEPGLAGVQVSLFDQNGNLVSTTSTLAGGFYFFSNVSPDAYFVRFTLLSGLSFSPPDIGTDDAIDSDAQPGTGDTQTFTVSAGDMNTYMDAGMYREDDQEDIRGRKWNDVNGNGIWDVGESGLANWQIILDSNQDGVLDGSPTSPDMVAITNANGDYIFTGNFIGSYIVGEILQSGWQQTFPKTTTGSHIGNVGPYDHLVSVVSGQTVSGVDFGNTNEGGQDQLDFGDAPDPTFPTLLANNGARHTIQQGFYLGTGIDPEPNGLPSILADGDDNNNTNDEDGVLMSPFVAPGQSVPITITASAAGAINAWMDFNIDGDWADPGEHIIAAQPVVAGANSFTVTVPGAAVKGLSFARFRFSSVRQLSYDGPAPDGEVEDYAIEIKDREDGSIKVIKDAMPKDNTSFWFCAGLKSGFLNIICFPLRDPVNNSVLFLNPSDVIDISEATLPGWTLTSITIAGDTDNGSTIDMTTGTVTLDFDAGENIVITFNNKKEGHQEEFDFGDAPDPTYPTLLASNGARHVLTPNLFLGSAVDPEPNGQPTGAADGDDKNITFPGIPFPSGDEDGVQLPPIMTKGSSVTIKVTASAPGVVNAWLDFNIDGDWKDAGEHIIAAQPVVAGVNLFTLNIPASATKGQTFARFRLSSVRDLSFDGQAPDGEVEDYAVSIEDRGNSKITIIKDAAPKDDTPFWISVVYGIFGGSAPYRDPSSNTAHITSAPAGTYSMGEFVPPGWALTDIVVTGDSDNGSTIDVKNGTAQIDVDAGENITIIFKNVKEGNGQGPPIKWMQIPLINEDPDMPYTPYFFGWDAKTVYDGTFVADDWFCKSPRPVTEIHWWGSYTDWDEPDPPPVAPFAFHIGVWTDVPAGEDKDWSHPGEMVWQWIVPREILEEHVVGDDFHPEYMSKPDSCFKYAFIIPPSDWFYQEGDSTIYWLSIAAMYDETPDEYVWGWKTREHFFHDDAVYVYEPTRPQIGDVAQENEPIDEGWDMSFVLGTDEPFMKFDFGDAPAERYPTFLGQNGALHIYDPGVHLGDQIDTELDGQPNHTSTGDDNDGSNDDDGIIFTAPTGGGQATVAVRASQAGYLNAWMDFNNNGSWADADEQIFKDEFIPGGESFLPVTIPDDAVPPPVFSRFRFSTEPGLSFVGIAIDGEVEDYYADYIIDNVASPGGDEEMPDSYQLYQNYPNPFNAATIIPYDVKNSCHVKLVLYDVLGHKVRTLIDEEKRAGHHQVSFHAKNLTSGIYYARIRMAGFSNIIKIVYLR